MLPEAAGIILAAKSRSRRQIVSSALSSAEAAVAENRAQRTSLETCLQTVRELAAAQDAAKAPSIVDDGEGLEAAVTRWTEHLKRHTITDKDMWLYVQCGHWEDHPQGWTGELLLWLVYWSA